jgi:hypothetical protein
MSPIPLAVLDLIPRGSGAGTADTVQPGRLDLGLGLGLGRSIGAANRGGAAHTADQRAGNGLSLPRQYDVDQRGNA